MPWNRNVIGQLARLGRKHWGTVQGVVKFLIRKLLSAFLEIRHLDLWYRQFRCTLLLPGMWAASSHFPAFTRTTLGGTLKLGKFKACELMKFIQEYKSATQVKLNRNYVAGLKKMY